MTAAGICTLDGLVRHRLAISFSGGRTSAYMLLHCLKYMADRETIITFANTGCEHPATLDFVHRMDQHIGGRVVWLEADVSPVHGKGVGHRVVSYETASRNGEPFERAVAKYGIFGPSHPQCTSRLKTEVMESYCRSIGWPTGEKSRRHLTAIGIRYDEIDRLNTRADALGFIYPLVDAKVTKDMVRDFWSKQPFDLQLPGDHYGNCVWCWKKSARKLMTLAKDSPDVFDFPRRMEQRYETVKAQNEDGVRRFFRENRSVDDIFRMAAQPFAPYRDNVERDLFSGTWDEALDIGGACGDSCEIGADGAHDLNKANTQAEGRASRTIPRMVGGTIGDKP